MYAARGLGGRKHGAHHTAESLVHLLLQYNASLSATDKDGHTALMWACWSAGHAHAIEPFLSRCAGLHTPLDDACVQIINTRNKLGVTALMMVARHGRGDAAKLLLQRGADANMRSRSSETALMIAAERGDAALVKLLLGWGAHDAGGMAAAERCSASRIACAEVRELLRAASDSDERTHAASGASVMHTLQTAVWALWAVVKPWVSGL
jgi:hypothetical protein